MNKLNSEWPAGGLEQVSMCPVCGADDREDLYEGLTDRVFFCAPGVWSMYRCKSCGSAYLDPRPNSETIGLAYKTYFTHSGARGFSSLTTMSKIRRRLANGYRNRRYGTKDYPASVFGSIASFFLPNARASMDAGMRHLPRIKDSLRLLDLGCGSGQFLARAQSAGWEAVGIDSDPKAIEKAGALGLDARLGSVENLEFTDEKFNVITLGHVIEHVLHPVQLMKKCLDLLEPGGYLWIDTPNLESEGCRIFGADWIHLDPPRHLVLFTLESMCNALRTVGFSNIEIQPYRPMLRESFLASRAISNGLDPIRGSNGSVPYSLVRRLERSAKINPKCREFITVKAWKA